METVTDFIFLVSRITADSDCSHEIKRWTGGTWWGRREPLQLAGLVGSTDAELKTGGIELATGARGCECPPRLSPIPPTACKIQYCPVQVSRILDSKESYFNAAE